MSVDSSVQGSWWRILILVACLALEGALLWYNYEPAGVLRHPGVIAFVSVALLLALTATGLMPVPRGLNLPLFGVWPNLSDSIKAVASFAAIFVWTPLARQLVPDTIAGVVIVLAPDAVFVIAALIYLSNSLSRGSQ